MESLIVAAIDWPVMSAGLLDLLSWAKNIGLVALGLGFVIFVHELGHFLVAKACGVKCEKFYVGFDVPIPLGFFTIPGKLFHFQWGETEYGVGAIPLGGYVKMLGQDDNPNNAETEEERTHVRDSAGQVRLDPRSYQAKSVPQRMAIISAGVIMNLIFGLIFAAIAYHYGVMIQPAVIGGTSPGDPAWKHNLQAGDRILQIGKAGQPNEHMRFTKDMMLNLALYGKFDQDYDILVRRRDGKEEWLQMRPSDRHRNAKEGLSRPTLGITSSGSTTFGKIKSENLPLLGFDFAHIVVEEADRFVEINKLDDIKSYLSTRPNVDVKLVSRIGAGDKLLAIDGESVRDYADVQRLMARKPGETVELTIERAPQTATKAGEKISTSEQYQLELSPLPVRDYGIEMAISAITAIQPGSPAEKAGLQVGDRLVSFDGRPIGDPLSFPQQTLSHVGETVKVVVQRGDEKTQQTIAIPVTLREPRQMLWTAASTGAAVETLGIAYEISTKIAKVREDGPAVGKLQMGDEIVQVQFKAGNAAELATETKAMRQAIPVDGRIVGWPAIVHQASLARLPDTKLVVTVKRNGASELIVEELTSIASTECFIDHHGLGIALSPLEEMHRAESMGESLSLGMREMKERVTEVFTVLVGLVTGRISPMNLGGGISIFNAAANEADRGVTDLLLFFAFLSANLAVLNILPIPVLDGGHLMFLLYEGIRRKPVNPEIQMRLTYAGLLLLLALMLFANGLDVWKLFV